MVEREAHPSTLLAGQVLRNHLDSMASLLASSEDAVGHLVLPSSSPEEWQFIESVLRGPSNDGAGLDSMLTQFSSRDPEPKVATFFSSLDWMGPETASFDFALFYELGLPLMLEVALEMPTLFPAEAEPLPIFKMRSSWPAETGVLGEKRSVSLTRRQCACLLAHSFFGSLKRPPGVELNDFRFTVRDLFVGTAASPTSGVTFLNYFTVLAQRGTLESEDQGGVVTFDRQGYRKGPSPWQWDGNGKPLCRVEIVDGSVDDCVADAHAEFANAYVGGGVMTGDAAMEETLFLVKPELMVAMALQGRMVDEEVVSVSGARKYSSISGFGQNFVSMSPPHPLCTFFVFLFFPLAAHSLLPLVRSYSFAALRGGARRHEPRDAGQGGRDRRGAGRRACDDAACDAAGHEQGASWL